jgi:hypothetical protein
MQIETTGIEDIAHKRRNAADLDLEMRADRDFIEMLEGE